MNIHEGVKTIDHGLLIPSCSTVIISDLHIGKEEELRREGLNIPVNGYKDIISRIKKILKQYKPNTFIINGDVKHNFGRFGYQEWKRVNNVFQIIQEVCNLHVIKGNHDKIITSATNKAGLSLKHHLKLKHYYICHGHKKHTNKDYKESKVIIIGHLHPKISIGDGIREETYECFLQTKHENKVVLTTPSFNMLSEGSDILKHKSNTPYITEQEMIKANTYVLGEEEEPYYFGTALDIKQRSR